MRVLAQLFIASAVMVLGYDALSALESGSINPVSLADLAHMISAWWDGSVTATGILEMAASWPAFAQSTWAVLVAGPAFFVLGLIGLILALLFRSR